MPRRDLTRRSAGHELMDADWVDVATFEGCLRDLERINGWTRSYALTLRWLDRLMARHGAKRPLVVLDVGSGHGDMLRRIWRWARGRGVEVRLIGMDRSPHATAAAARATPHQAPIRYLTAELFDERHELATDVVISAMFAHHLDDAGVVRFLRWMEARARLGWLINDLHRHPLPYHVSRYAPRILRMNRLVRHDAALSVARGFKRGDWQRLLTQAEVALPLVTIAWHFPFRYAVGRIKPCPADPTC